ncbi:Hypothetical protein NTJ_02052 [Nesidiocoris tenuis]|uniref:Uncharacterized protein n=1 Tax=Nesidiocoris tenuis TaxID=355587 RepID=A0ABN7AAA0_9HEMI|nr:Hypothetical protein NTJ_02052 [Nesidiocoris tenuis]
MGGSKRPPGERRKAVFGAGKTAELSKSPLRFSLTVPPPERRLLISQAPTPNSGLVGTPCTSRGASPPLRLSLVHVRFTRRSSRSRSVNTHTRAARLSPIRIRRFAAPKCGTGAVPNTSAARPNIGRRENFTRAEKSNLSFS